MRRTSKHTWEDAYAVIEPQINADSVHVWPFPPGFPVDVRFLRFGPKSDIRMNRHDYFEMLCIHSGAVTYQVQDRFYPVAAGDLFLMGSTLLHRISDYETPGMRAAVLYFMPEVLSGGDSAGEQMEYLMPFRVQEIGFPHVVSAATGVPAQIYDLMARASAELPAASTRARLSVKTYLRMMLVVLVNHFSAWRGADDVFDRRHRNLDRVQPLFDYLDRNYRENISVEAAAELLHMSKSTFMRFFKEVTGQSFVGYLNRFRVAKAEAMLANTDLSILDVSQEAGFCDQSYFGLVFRNLLGITPREYKARLKNDDRRRA